MATSASPTPAQIQTYLTSQGLPTPSPSWLRTLLSTQRPNIPLAAISATARHRLLSSNFVTDSVLDPAANPTFPPDITNPAVKETRLQGIIPVQVLDVEDLSRSRYEQIEAIEAVEKGEFTKGREIVRVVATAEGEEEDDGEDGGGVARRVQRPNVPGVPGSGNGGGIASGGMHRLVLQDLKGRKVYAMELKSVPKVGLGMDIGTKILLKGSIVARGMILLEPSTTVVLGGKVENLHKAWLENRKKVLEEIIKPKELERR